MINGFLQNTYLNNRVIDYLIAMAIFFILIVFIQIAKKLFIKAIKAWAKKSTTTIDDKFVKAFEEKIKNFLSLVYFGAFYISIKRLTMESQIEHFFNIFVSTLLIFFGIQFLLSIGIYGLETYWVKKEKDKSKKQAIKGIITILKFIVWSIVFIIVLDNLGIKISTLVAGLGIGGIAIALAAQTVLGDLFSYFIIFFDRPFEIGDFIIVDDFKGTVEYIGLKTTRLSSLGGEQLIFSNMDLTNSRIKNYKRMNRRRIVFQFGVTYQTDLEKMKKIPVLVKEIIIKLSETTFDRVHFASYGDFSLNYEVVYYIHSNDYNTYMNIQQEINFQLKEAFEKQEIEFAYPTQTIFMTNENSK